MKWVKDLKVESFMRRLGIKFEVERIRVEHIDVDEGLRRQARLINKLNEDHVFGMSVAMLNEDAAFPMIVVQKPPHGKNMWIWSGNHRFAAFIMAFPMEETIELYTCTIIDTVTIDTFPRVINCLESSIGFSKEERIINGIWLMNEHSYSAKEAAEMVQVKPEALYNVRRAEQVKTELIGFGIKVNGMPQTTFNKLSTVSENKNVLRSAARVTSEYDLKGDELSRFIQDIRSGKTEAAQLTEVSNWTNLLEERRKPKTGKKIIRKVRAETPIRERFLKDITDLGKVLERYDTLEKLQCTDPADREILARHWPLIASTMNKIAKQEFKS